MPCRTIILQLMASEPTDSEEFRFENSPISGKMLRKPGAMSQDVAPDTGSGHFGDEFIRGAANLLQVDQPVAIHLAIAKR